MMRHDRIDPSVGGPPSETAVLVRDRMTRPVITIGRSATVEAAWTLMQARRVRHLPVVDDGERLVGIVTDRDLRPFVSEPAAHERQADLVEMLPRLTVERVMTAAAVTVRPDSGIGDAVRLMHERKIGALPVVEDGRVVGILSGTDVLGVFLEVLGERSAPRSLGGRWPTRSPSPAHTRGS